MALLTWAGFLNFLWRWRWILLPIAIYLAGMATWGWIDGLRDSNAALKREKQDLIATNQATMEALDKLGAEKARNETLLADRAARKSKEAERLGKLVQHILESKDEGACPSLPVLSDTISRLP